MPQLFFGKVFGLNGKYGLISCENRHKPLPGYHLVVENHIARSLRSDHPGGGLLLLAHSSDLHYPAPFFVFRLATHLPPPIQLGRMPGAAPQEPCAGDQLKYGGNPTVLWAMLPADYTCRDEPERYYRHRN